MENKSVREYLFNKLFFPKSVILNEPGIIISRTFKRFSKQYIQQRRLTMHFDEIMSRLQLATSGKLGKKQSSDLWYKIGKESAMRNFLFHGDKKIPLFLVNSTLSKIFTAFQSAGMPKIEKINFNPKLKSLIIKGKTPFIQNQPIEVSIYAGVVSGVISWLLNENLESEFRFINDKKEFVIISNMEINEIHIVNKEKLKPSSNFARINFKKQENRGYYSFNDLIRFRKIKVDKNGRMYFKNKLIVCSEIGLLGIIYYQYKQVSHDNLFQETLTTISQDFFKEIFEDISFKKNKIKLFLSLLSAFGWGIPHLKTRDNHEVELTLVGPPITRYGFLYEASVINGFFNYVFGVSFQLQSIKNRFDPRKIVITYLARNP